MGILVQEREQINLSFDENVHLKEINYTNTFTLVNNIVCVKTYSLIQVWARMCWFVNPLGVNSTSSRAVNAYKLNRNVLHRLTRNTYDGNILCACTCSLLLYTLPTFMYFSCYFIVFFFLLLFIFAACTEVQYQCISDYWFFLSLNRSAATVSTGV